MKKVVLFIVCIVLMHVVQAGTKNWTNSNGTNLWSDAGNWSGGLPGTGDDVKFKSSATDNCNIDINVDVKSITIESGYTGTISVNSGVELILNSSGFDQSDGNFMGSDDSIHVKGDFKLDGGTFTSTSHFLVLEDKWSTNGGDFIHNNGTVKVIDATAGFETFGNDLLYRLIIDKADGNKTFDLRNNDTVSVEKLLQAKTGDIDGGGIVMIWDSLDIQTSFDEWKDAEIVFSGPGGSFNLGIPVFNPDQALSVVLNNTTDTLVFNTSNPITDFGNNAYDFTIGKGVFKNISTNEINMNWNSLQIGSNGTWVHGKGTVNIDQDITNSGGKIRNQGAGTINLNYSNTLNLDVELGDAVYNLDVNMGDKKNLVIPTGDTLIIKGDLNINDGKILNGNLEAWGDVTIRGDFDGGDADLKFGGPNAQTWDMSGDDEVWQGNVIMSKQSAEYVTLQSQVKLREAGTMVKFVKGYFITTDTTLLWLDWNVSGSWGSDSSFVDGPLRAEGRNAFTFSVGKNKIFAPLGVANISNKNSHWTVEYQPYNADDDGYDRSLREPSIDYVCDREFWEVHRGNGNPSASIQLFWNYPVRSCHVEHPDSMKVLRWDGPNNQWVDHGNGGVSGDTIEGSVITGGDLNNFTIPFALGGGPPPVILGNSAVDFTATLDNGIVDLDWTSETPYQVSHYEVERSGEGSDFETILSVSAPDYVTIKKEFAIVDDQPLFGNSYYRLKEVYTNGKFAYSNVEYVSNTYSINELVNVYPNPSEGVFTVDLSKFEQAEHVKVMDQNGRTVHREQVNEHTKVDFDLSDLAGGMYYLQILDRYSVQSLPLIVR